MNTGEIGLLLREHRARWQELGVKTLALFGSVVRGEARPDSDVDVLVEFSEPVTFDRYMEVRFFLEDLLGRKVDLVLLEAIKPRLREQIMAEAIYA